MVGRVVSTKLENTATVLVSRIATHPLYKKTFVRSKKFLADNQIGVKDGDLVEIVITKPVSKRKHWKIVKVLGRSFKEIAEQHLKEKGEEVIAEVMPEEKEEANQLTSELVNQEEKKVKPKAKKKGGSS